MTINFAVGLVFSQAFAALSFTYCRRIFPSIILSAIILFLSTKNSAFLNGADYPISVFSQESYGVLGLGLVLLAMGLFGIGWLRSALVMMGVAVSVHPLIGLWGICSFAIALPWIYRFFAPLPWRSFLPCIWATSLIVCAAVSFSLGLRSTVGLPDVDPRYLHAALYLWDGHRNVPFDTKQALIVLQASIVAVLLLMTIVRHRGMSSRYCLTVVLLVQAVLGIILYLGYHLVPMAFPTPLVVAMPSRFLNFAVAVSIPVTVGILLCRRFDMVTLFVLCLLAFAALNAWLLILANDELALLTIEIGALAIAVAIILAGPRLPVWISLVELLPLPLQERSQAFTESYVGRRGIFVSVILATIIVAAAFQIETPAERILNTPAVKEMGALLTKSPGAVIVADDLDINKLPALLPNLLDFRNLDNFPYVPATAPKAAAILMDLCSVNYLDPPVRARGTGGLPGGICRKAWETRTRSGWREISRKYGVAMAVTPASWSVDLPVLWAGLGLTIYSLGP